MNVAAHQEKKKNEETKTGMKKAEERKRQSTDFRKAVCCPSAVVQGTVSRFSQVYSILIVTDDALSLKRNVLK